MKFFILFVLIIHSPFFFGMTEDELSQSIKEWKADCYAKSNKNSLSSHTEFYTEKFNDILSQGPEIATFLISEFKAGNGEIIVFFPKLFKLSFDSSFDLKEKKWLFIDYPKYVYHPPGFHLDTKPKINDSIWVYWWDEGRRLTPEIFHRKYEAYQAAKKANNESEIKEKYFIIQNMGIIILPNLLEKIKNGDSDLISMFCYLSEQNELKTAADCEKWWNENKEKYKDLLNY